MSATATADTRVAVALTAAAGAAGAAVVTLGNPYRSSWFPPCPFKALTGLDCPGCGSTRAVHELTNGDLVAAFGLNPLLMVVLPFAIYAYVAWGVRAFTGRQLPLPQLGAKASLVALAVLVSFGVARNLPVPALAWMAP